MGLKDGVAAAETTSAHAWEITECGGKGDVQVEAIQLEGGRVNLISRSVNRVGIAGRVLSFLLLEIKHLWTFGQGERTRLARDRVYPISKYAQKLLWLCQRRNVAMARGMCVGQVVLLLLCKDSSAWNCAAG